MSARTRMHAAFYVYSFMPSEACPQHVRRFGLFDLEKTGKPFAALCREAFVPPREEMPQRPQD